MIKFAAFDAADYLSNDETVAEYISAALEDPDPDAFLTAARDVARARGMNTEEEREKWRWWAVKGSNRPAPDDATSGAADRDPRHWPWPRPRTSEARSGRR